MTTTKNSTIKPLVSPSTPDLFWFSKTRVGWEVQLGETGTPKLSPFTDRDIEFLLSKCKVKQGNSLHFALTQRELDTYLELSEEELTKLSKQRFLEVSAGVIEELVKAEDRLSKLEGIFKRLKAGRLLRLCAQYKGVIVQIQDTLLQWAEKRAPLSYQRVVERLVEEKPNLKKLVDQLMEAEREGKENISFLYKHTTTTEPTSWQKLPHKRLSNLLEVKFPVGQFETLLNTHITYLSNLLADLTSNAAEVVAAAPQPVAAKQVPFPVGQKIEQVIRLLQSLDWGQDPTTLVPVLERARNLLHALHIKPTDVELAIKEDTTDATKAQKFIEGPSGRASGKGAIGDLQALLAAHNS